MHKLTHELHKYNPHCFPHCGRITDHYIVSTCEYLLKAKLRSAGTQTGWLTTAGHTDTVHTCQSWDRTRTDPSIRKHRRIRRMTVTFLLLYCTSPSSLIPDNGEQSPI